MQNETNVKLIKPSEISARILTLLDESDERVIIVSPYIKISKWYKFINKVNGLKSRRINTEIYVRDDPDNTATYRDLDQLGLEYKKIPHLHSKLYLNERYGIVTSMNLLLSSEINSLEIGYATETWAEYNDLLGFYHRYIRIGDPIHCETVSSQPAADLKEITHSIGEDLKSTGKNSWLWLAENVLHISTGRNNYKVSINEGKLRITACLKIGTATQQKSTRGSSLIEKKVGDLTAMKIQMHHRPKAGSKRGSESGYTPGPMILPDKDPKPSFWPLPKPLPMPLPRPLPRPLPLPVLMQGPKPDILQLSGQAQYTLKSTCINGILEDEAAYITESVVRFINASDNLVFLEGFISSQT